MHYIPFKSYLTPFSRMNKSSDVLRFLHISLDIASYLLFPAPSFSFVFTSLPLFVSLNIDYFFPCSLLSYKNFWKFRTLSITIREHIFIDRSSSSSRFINAYLIRGCVFKFGISGKVGPIFKTKMSNSLYMWW